MRDGLATHVVRFGRALRDAGFKIGSDGLLDALRALQLVGVGRRSDVKAALAALWITDPTERDLFDRLFDQYWGWAPVNPDAVGSNIELQGHPQVPPPGDGDGGGPSAMGKPLAVTGPRPALIGDDAGAGKDQEAPPQTAAYSPLSLARRDLAHIPASDLPRLRRLAENVARQLATRFSRRAAPSGRVNIYDQRKTIRRVLSRGGELWQLERKRRAVRRPQLVLLCDVSGSMTVYARVLLVFAYALHHVPGGHRVETYTFGTDLYRVTPIFRRRRPQAALDAALQGDANWAGGTRIGQSLYTFRRLYAPSQVNKQTTLVILSDGLDTGDIDLLADQMRWLSRRAGRIIWLNPLAGDPRYQPLAAGMAAALPYVDVLAPAHNLASLADLSKHL